MNENQIRQEVRAMLREMMQHNNAAYYVGAGGNKFPYNEEDGIVGLPSDIDTKEEYLVNWKEMSDNQDVYGFPMKEFVSGLQVEKAKRSIFSIFDLAKIVINNLKENPHFYSNLGV